jgi:putative transposase
MLNKQQRELIIRLKQDGKNQQQIAHLIGCSQAAVSKWISKNKTGRTLETLPRSGRPTKLTKNKIKNLKKTLLTEIKNVNEKYCSLNTKQLSNIIKKEVGIEYSIRHVERIMHKLGFSLITPRTRHIKHDQKKVDEFRANFKKNFKRSTWVLSS